MTTVIKKTKQRKGVSTRDHILKVATELFARDGFDRVTMRDISSAVGLTMPTIYHHFQGKENLYRQVEQENYGAMKARLLAALESDEDAKGRLRAFVGEMYDLLSEDPIFLSLAVRNMLDQDARHHKFLVGVALQEVFESFSVVLNEIRAGSGDGLGPVIIISGILGFVLMAPPKRQLKGYKLAGKVAENAERDAFISYAVGAVLRV